MNRSDVTSDPAKSPPRPPLVRDDVAYMIPMFTFLGFTWVGATWQQWYPTSYVAKTIIVALLLVILWRQFTPIRWNYWWLGVIIGVIGIFQWVGMQLWLQTGWPEIVERMTFLPAAMREGLANHFRPGDFFDPTQRFESQLALWSFIAIRMAGAVLLVPVMEELFWRDWLWRTIIAPNDFKLAQVGEWDWRPFVVVCLAFAVVHGNWWLTSIVWAVMIAGLLVYTKSLGACIIAHAVTNLLLAIYVLWTRDWSFW